MIGRQSRCTLQLLFAEENFQMSKIIGRKTELSKLKERADSKNAQFLAIYGRRRVGKTFLIREFFATRDCIFCTVTGQNEAPRARQLAIFQKELESTFFGGERLPLLKTWDEAFEQLVVAVKTHAKNYPTKEIVVFLDELPWLATRKSGLLGALDHTWNTQLQYVERLRLVVCGSAASFMTKNIIHSRGGLHNRLSGVFRLRPFSFSETKLYLAKIIGWTSNETQILELYMALGGIPHYLSLVQKKLSAAQNIGNLLFGDGELSGEFDRLFSSLFAHSSVHMKVIKALASKNSGLTREEILKAVGKVSGETTSVVLHELDEAGFIMRFQSIHKKNRGDIYRLMDEFSLFHCRWLESIQSQSLLGNPVDYWLRQTQTQPFAIWSGYAFENICLKHASLLKKKLGFAAVNCKIGPFYTHLPGEESEGAQIDLVFERADGVTTLVEMKYRPDLFTVTKIERLNLERKVRVYTESTRTKQYVNVALVTPYGVKPNEHSQSIVSGEVTLVDLFGEE